MLSPTLCHKYILGNKCIAQFAYLKHLYRIEEGKPLKVAHALKKVSLNPSSIAQTSLQHILGKLKVFAIYLAVRLPVQLQQNSCYSTMTIDYGTRFFN